jgi:chromosome condensin MukBEF MukE localization factor
MSKVEITKAVDRWNAANRKIDDQDEVTVKITDDGGKTESALLGRSAHDDFRNS